MEAGIVLPFVSGAAVHDPFCSRFQFTASEDALCNALDILPGLRATMTARQLCLNSQAEQPYYQLVVKIY
jgi:hypothetical protein